MKIAIYTGSTEIADEIHARIIPGLPSSADLFFLRSVTEMETQLRASRLDSMVILLAPDGQDDMMGLFNLHDLLRGARLLVMLPHKSSPEILNWAHSLYPRYLCFQPDGMSHIGKVITNLCAAEESAALHGENPAAIEEGLN